jgi:hypothetical protein
MIRHTARLAATTVITALALAVGSSALANEDYNFPADCGPEDIQTSSPLCMVGHLVIDVDVEGNIEWTRETAYPRPAFEAFIREVDQHEGTTEEYLEAAIADNTEEGRTEFDYDLTDDHLIVAVTIIFAPDDPDVEFVGIVVADEDVTATINPANAQGVNRVTLTTPGDIRESNGDVDGNTVIWSGDVLLSGAPLTAQASTVEGVDARRWIIAGLALLFVGILAALYFGLLRKRPNGQVDPIDLEPVFEEEVEQDATTPAEIDGPAPEADSAVKVATAESMPTASAAKAPTKKAAAPRKSAAPKKAATPRKAAPATSEESAPVKKPAARKPAAKTAVAKTTASKTPAAKKPAAKAAATPRKAAAPKKPASPRTPAAKKPAATKKPASPTETPASDPDES